MSITASGIAKLMIVALGGVDVTTALGIKVPVETFAYDTDAGALYVMQTVAGTASWARVGGGASTGGKYFVSNQATPAALYTTISAAITAAVADGHNTANPAVILILPGTYTESVTMRPGISLVGMGGVNNAGSVTIVGTVTESFVAPGTCGISDLNISGNFVYGGTQDQSVYFLNVNVGASSGDAISDSNSGSGRINTFNSEFSTTDAAGLALRSTHARSGTLHESQFAGVQANGSMLLTAASMTFRRCLITGMVTLATSGTTTFSESRMRATGNPVITVGASTGANISRCTLETDASKVIDGTGDLTTNDNICTNGSLIGSGLVTSAARCIGQLVHSKPAVVANAALYPAGSDVALIDDSLGIVTVTLQPIANYLDGQVIRVKSMGAANVVTVKGNGAENIDAANTQALNVTRGYITLMADRTDNLWRVIALK